MLQETGYIFLELNASDTRSKKSLDKIVSEYLHNSSIRSYYGDDTSKGHKHCLVMDEIDGMAGNEDRGGIQVCGFLFLFVVCILFMLQ